MNHLAIVNELIERYFWKMPEDASINSGEYAILPEEAYDFLQEYFSVFNIDTTGFEFRRYFPNEGIRFLPNIILPDYLKTDRHQPEPLTIQMLMESAKSGKWLYN